MSSASRIPTTPEEEAADLARMLRAMTRAVREAVEVHRRMGNPIATWKDGHVVWIQPQDIPPYDPAVDEVGE